MRTLSAIRAGLRMACEVNTGPGGTSYRIPEDDGRHTRTKDGITYAELECWWGRRSFIIRQENSEAADVLELSQGQVYDLIDALNRAIGLPGPQVGNEPA